MSIGRILSDILEKNKALQETIERQQTIIAGLTRDRDELKAALANEREWTKALAQDSKMQCEQLDKVSAALGFKDRTDKTDVWSPISALRAEFDSLKREFLGRGDTLDATQGKKL